jgi:hypothetical protein
MRYRNAVGIERKRLNRRAAPYRITLVLWSMSEHDPNETLREFREYFARSYESQKKIAARVGVTQATFLDLLTCQRQPKPTTLAKLQTFLEAEAKPEGGGVASDR